MFDVAALGELLIDFTPAGNSTAGNALFEMNPGGAPANVLTAVTRLGGKGALLGKVGDDQFGHYLRKVLLDNNIEDRGLKFSKDVNTTLAFVHLDEKGDRSFSFYRKPGADTTLSQDDLELNLIKQSRIFHFGSLSLTDEPSRSTTVKAVEFARQAGSIISYDPNWRAPLWKSEQAAKEGMLLCMEYADILKLSEIEMEFLTGEKGPAAGSKIFGKMGIRLVVVTMGPDGCYYRYGDHTGHLNTFNVKVADTTGAGDAFLGGLLYRISRRGAGLDGMDVQELLNVMGFANAVGALCASKRGAIPAMPVLEEVRRCMEGPPELV